MIRALLIAALLAASAGAAAHTRSQSYSHWTLDADGQLRGTFTIDARRATLLYGDAGSGELPDRLAAHLSRSVSARQSGEACAARPVEPRPAPAGFISAALGFDCAAGGEPPVLRIDAIFRFAATHLHVATVQLPGGRRIERALTPQQPELIAGREHAAQGFAGFLRAGAVHVLSGADHVAFVIALLLCVRGLGPRIATITAFSLGHSLTLALASLGWIAPRTGWVEALVGFSVLLAAIDAARPASRERFGIRALVALLGLVAVIADPSQWLLVLACLLLLFSLPAMAAAPRRGVALATAFGLIHGSAFAGVLIDAALPPSSVWPALLGFNLGVEIGQLLIVAGFVAVVALGRRRPPLAAGSRRVTLTALSALGSYWFAARLLAV